MGPDAGNLFAANIVIVGAGVVCFALLMLWGRAVRGTWPGRTKRLVFLAYIFAVIIGCNALYFYFRSH